MSKDSDTPFPGPNCYTGTQSERLDRMEHKIDRVYVAMIGDERMGNRGMVPRLIHVETTLAKIAEERAAESNARRGAMWVVGTTAAVIGAVGAMIGGVIKAVFTNHG
jgi:hypothetical protein